MRTKHILIILTAAFIFTQASAKTQDDVNKNQPMAKTTLASPSLKMGQSFLAARSNILRSGWHPIKIPKSSEYEYIGIEKELANRKFFEMDSCSIDAGSLCTLYYSKKANCLRVGTIGEQLKYMKVRYWTDECLIVEAPSPGPYNVNL